MNRGRPERDDSGAALLTVVLLILVLSSLSIMVLSAVITQVRPTRFTQTTARTVFAAESGIQASLGVLRTAVAASPSGAAYGDPAQLPCSLAGQVGEPAEQLTYSVVIRYYAEDPAGRAADWRAGHALTCTTGGLSTVPRYALISSQGLQAGVAGASSSSGDRQLESRYVFQVTNENVPGGLFRTASAAFCLEAEALSAGAAVRYRSAEECAERSPTQLWVQDASHAVKLASTLHTTPLCLARPSTGTAVTVEVCVAAQGDQMWSYRSYFRYRGQNVDNTAPGDGCLWAGAQTTLLAGRALEVGADGCATGAATNSVREWWSWNPEPAVGAGSAGAATRQLVNFQEFGRCLEVTQESTAATTMGIGPCKQGLPGNGNVWNQVWAHTEAAPGAASTAPQLLRVTIPDGRNYCLQVPAAGAVAPLHPVLARPCSTADPRQLFVRTGDTGDYTTSYLLLDHQGRCLGAGPQYSPDGSVLSSVVIEGCTGALDQKWNAPPDLVPAATTHTHEES